MYMSEGVDPNPPSLTQIHSQLKKQYFGPPTTIVNLSRALYDVWPRYPHDHYWKKLSTTTKPLLLINGDIDISTPWSACVVAMNGYVEKENVISVLVPTTPHVSFFESPVKNSPVPCTMQIVVSFYQSGGKSTNSSCLSEMVSMKWKGDTKLSQQIYGTPDAWQI